MLVGVKLLFDLSIFCWLLSKEMLVGVIWKYFLSSYCLLCQFFVGRYQTKCLWESSENIFCLVVIKRNARGSNLKIFLIKLLFALLIFCWLLSNKMLVGIIWKPFFFNFLFALSIFCWLLSNKMLVGVIWKYFLSSYYSLCQFFWLLSNEMFMGVIWKYFCQVIVRFVNFLLVVKSNARWGDLIIIFVWILGNFVYCLHTRWSWEWYENIFCQFFSNL